MGCRVGHPVGAASELRILVWCNWEYKYNTAGNGVGALVCYRAAEYGYSHCLGSYLFCIPYTVGQVGVRAGVLMTCSCVFVPYYCVLVPYYCTCQLWCGLKSVWLRNRVGRLLWPEFASLSSPAVVCSSVPDPGRRRGLLKVLTHH
jgi:hypothetical protein